VHPSVVLVVQRVMGRVAILAILAVSSVAWADPPALDDARFGTSAAEMHRILDGAAHAGLPVDLLADKAREGLAKGVPPARIVAVVGGLADSLARARTEALAVMGAPSAPLLRAIVEAHAAGAAAGDVTVVLRAGGRDRSMQVLTDLAQRGYPAGDAARIVAGVGSGRPLDRLVGEAERLRTIDGATPAQALDALARANAQGLGLDHAEQMLHHGGAAASDDGNDPNRETSGVRGPKSGGVAAPGKAKGH
jgi:hypothetical protein